MTTDPTRVDGDVPLFTKNNLPAGAWAGFRKKTTTRALRIAGEFEVDTTEGPLRCHDGWLAIDSRGYPYPIAADEFDAIYEPAPAAQTIAPDGIETAESVQAV